MVSIRDGDPATDNLCAQQSFEVVLEEQDCESMIINKIYEPVRSSATYPDNIDDPGVLYPGDWIVYTVTLEILSSSTDIVINDVLDPELDLRHYI